jgi:ubiquinone biosynthesis protein UbiJ
MLVEAAVPHLEILLNRKLRDSISAREYCKTLDTKVLEINIESIPDRILLAPIGETIEILIDKELKADVTFSGSIMHFMQATQTKPMELVRKGQLKMKGDAVLAGQFQRLIELSMPDWQEEIAKLFGDYAGPQISSFLTGIATIGQQLMQGLGNPVADADINDSQNAPDNKEFSAFKSELKDLENELNNVSESINKL